MKITVNDENQEVPSGTTIASLLGLLNMQPRFVAVERNKELIPRGEHSGCELQENDQVEIVTLVGGG